ncbi:MAG: hypothetical protein H0X62_10755 [Bacteroidetes bacterium]|nr:hypothetical protein [Bacteroidota bacterium]
MRIIIMLFFFIANVCFAAAQTCGTLTFNAVALEAANNHYSDYQQFKGISKCLNKTLSLNYIIVTDPYYNTNVTMADINANLKELNDAFSPICLSFQICNIDTLYEHKYDSWNRMEEEAEFQVLFCKENVINIILVGGLDPYASSIGIFTPSLPAKDFILLPKDYLLGKMIAHQMGHLFGLYHTYETAHGLELVNESNCTTSGDLVCDTPADILPAPWLWITPFIQVCVWDGLDADTNGDKYAPIFGNMMGDGPCPLTSFTVGQYNRMIYYFEKFRGYLK